MSKKGSLLLRMFGGRTRAGRTASLLHHVEHVMKSGYVEEPLWLEAMRECVSPPRSRAARRLTLALAGRRRPPSAAPPADRARSSFQRRAPPRLAGWLETVGRVLRGCASGLLKAARC